MAWITIVIFVVVGLFFFYRWNQKPVAWTHDDVAALLESWISDNVDDIGWDYFEACHIIDPELEEIRQQALEVIHFSSPYIDHSYSPGIRLNEKGKKIFRELKAKCICS